MKLHENIRSLRKRCALTQEQLAEALNVTTGAVYKWESGRSTPEVSVLMELAELFGVSMDALLGFELRGGAVPERAERIATLQREKRYEEVAEEAENALKRYPNDFRIVFRSGYMYEHYGMEKHDEKLILRAIELLEQAIVLLPQNNDPDVNEMSISTQIALCHLSLGRIEQGTELLKKNNIMGVNDAQIGYTITGCRQMEDVDAIPYLNDAFLGCFSRLLHCTAGYANIHIHRGEKEQALEMVLWLLGYLESIRREDADVSYLDKLRAIYYALSGHLLYECGKEEEGKRYIRKGYTLARKFDAAPTYSFDTIKFYMLLDKQCSASDDMGQTAVEAVDHALRSDGDCAEEILRLWEELKDTGGDTTVR